MHAPRDETLDESTRHAITLSHARWLAAAAVATVDCRLEVVATIPMRNSRIIEVLVVGHVRRREPQCLLISIDRRLTPPAFRNEVAMAVRRQTRARRACRS